MEKVRFIAISGTTAVTQNMYVYEYLPDGKNVKDMIIVDCGVGFPEEAAFGVDLVIPDFTYVIKNKDKLRGLFISHAHEDHFGAVPFLAREIKGLHLYTARLTAEFIQDKLDDYGIDTVKIHVLDVKEDFIQAGAFRVECFSITHSVPDSLGFSITTPIGKLFHVPDYKFDWTPVSQRPFDVARMTELANNNVIALASDSLGATSEGYTKSEKEIEKNIYSIMENAHGRIFFTTISSNIPRIQQAINIARNLNRKVILAGRSIERKVEIARQLELLQDKGGTIIPAKQANKLQNNRLIYIISGCYGQVGSALYRLALGEHQFLNLAKGDTVIFSADPAPPGTEQTVNYVVDALIEKDIDVHYYDTQEDLHTSGHGSRKEIEMLMALVRAKYLIPIGGTIRHMRLYGQIAQQMGWAERDIFELNKGGIVEFTRDSGRVAGEISVQDVLVDGLGVGDVGNVVLRDRKTLAKEGIVVVVLQFDKNKGEILGRPDVISRGFVFAREQQGLLDRAGDLVVENLKKKRHKNIVSVREVIVDFMERYFFEKTGRRPMILPVIIEL